MSQWSNLSAHAVSWRGLAGPKRMLYDPAILFGGLRIAHKAGCPETISAPPLACFPDQKASSLEISLPPDED